MLYFISLQDLARRVTTAQSGLVPGLRWSALWATTVLQHPTFPQRALKVPSTPTRGAWTRVNARRVQREVTVKPRVSLNLDQSCLNIGPLVVNFAQSCLNLRLCCCNGPVQVCSHSIRGPQAKLLECSNKKTLKLFIWKVCILLVMTLKINVFKKMWLEA